MVVSRFIVPDTQIVIGSYFFRRFFNDLLKKLYPSLEISLTIC